MELGITLVLIGVTLSILTFILFTFKGLRAALDSKYEKAHKWVTFNSITSTLGLYLIVSGWLVEHIEGLELIWALTVAFASATLAFFHGRNQGISKSNIERWREKL